MTPTVHTQQGQPVTLHAIRNTQRYRERAHIHSVIVVTPLFRSSRSAPVRAATLVRTGSTVQCERVQESVGVNGWTQSWHGIQNVVEQWLKLHDDGLHVLPVARSPHEPPAAKRQ